MKRRSFLKYMAALPVMGIPFREAALAWQIGDSNSDVNVVYGASTNELMPGFQSYSITTSYDAKQEKMTKMVNRFAEKMREDRERFAKSLLNSTFDG